MWPLRGQHTTCEEHAAQGAVSWAELPASGLLRGAKSYSGGRHGPCTLLTCVLEDCPLGGFLPANILGPPWFLLTAYSALGYETSALEVRPN